MILKRLLDGLGTIACLWSQFILWLKILWKAGRFQSLILLAHSSDEHVLLIFGTKVNPPPPPVTPPKKGKIWYLPITVNPTTVYNTLRKRQRRPDDARLLIEMTSFNPDHDCCVSMARTRITKIFAISTYMAEIELCPLPFSLSCSNAQWLSPIPVCSASFHSREKWRSDNVKKSWETPSGGHHNLQYTSILFREMVRLLSRLG